MYGYWFMVMFINYGCEYDYNYGSNYDYSYSYGYSYGIAEGYSYDYKMVLNIWFVGSRLMVYNLWLMVYGYVYKYLVENMFIIIVFGKDYGYGYVYD